MCYHPINIINRSRRFRPGLDASVLTVPCGHCTQCEKKKQDDWFIRAMEEYKRVHQHGFVWFAHFTYSPKHLPRWYDKDYNYFVPVFDKSHFTSFRNKLRVYLSRKGYNFSRSNTIRYFAACEYGDNTGRSHLHVLLFVPKFVPYRQFKYLVQKAWIYGQVRYSPKGNVIQSPKGIQYAMKYLAKDMPWYNKYGVDAYINRLKDDVEKSTPDNYDYYTAKLKAFRRVLPFHLQSMGFGSDRTFTDDEFIKDSITTVQMSLFDACYTYNIPAYYKRKYLQDYDKLNKIFTINDRGLKIKKALLEKVIHSTDLYLSSLLYSDTVNSNIVSLFPSLFLDKDYDSFKRVINYYDSRDLAIYNIVYRRRSLDPCFFDKFSSMEIPNFLKLMDDNKFDFYESYLDNRKEFMIDDYRLNGARLDMNNIGFSDCNIYETFERCMKFIEKYESELNNLKQQADVIKSENAYKQYTRFVHYV